MILTPGSKGPAVGVAALPRRVQVYEVERIPAKEVGALQALPDVRVMEAARV